MALLLACAATFAVGYAGKQYINGGMVPPELLSHTDLSEKVAIITGASMGGIGHETASALYRLGANVVIAVRDVNAGEKVQQEILNHVKNIKRARNHTTGKPIVYGSVQVIKLDLADLDSVKLFADEFLDRYDRLDILVNNAGIMMTPHGTTKQGIEKQFGTNHLGHFLLTHLLLDILKKSNGRVINLSSRAGEHWVGGEDETRLVTDPSTKKNVMSGFASFALDTVNHECKDIKEERLYGRSKFANMVFARRLEREFRKDPTTMATAYSVHPGVVRTNLWRELNKLYFIVSYPFWWYGTKSPYQGAQTSIYLSIAPINDLKGGHYYADCKMEIGHKAALDEELQDRLWDTSMELCKEYIR